MKFSFRHTDKIVGTFMLVAVFIMFLSIIFLLINQKAFTKKHFYKTVFADKVGLKVNTEITFNGFNIGKLTKFKLNRHDMVEVDFYILDSYADKITKGSVLSKLSNPITGSSVYFIRNYNTEELVKDGAVLPSLDTEEGKMLLAAGTIKSKADIINNIIGNVDGILASLNSDRNADANSIARILVNSADVVEELKRELYSVSEMLDNFKELSYDMKDADGLVQKLVDPNGDYMFNSLQKSLNELTITMENLTRFSKFVNNQQKDIEQIMIEGQKSIDETQQVIEGLKNNPLIKGGIKPKKDESPTNNNMRDLEE